MRLDEGFGTAKSPSDLSPALYDCDPRNWVSARRDSMKNDVCFALC